MKLFSLKHARRGLTLTEVLVALFILAIGLLAIMSLFPIGALRVAAAMKDDRCAYAASNSEKLFRYTWKKAWLDQNGNLNDDDALTSNQLPTNPFGYQSSVNTTIASLDNRNATVPNTPVNFQVLTGGYVIDGNDAADPQRVASKALTKATNNPSWPVYIDPIGYVTQPSVLANKRNWLGLAAGGAGGQGNAATRLIPRRDLITTDYTNIITQLALPANLVKRLNIFTTTDEFTFDENGAAGNVGVTAVKREGNYNTAWLMQRQSNKNRAEVNLNVVVYRKRPATDVAGEERVLLSAINANAGNNRVLFSNTTGAPANIVRLEYVGIANRMPYRSGQWFLNASSYVVTETINGATTNTIRQYADFYRIVAVTEVATSPTNGIIELELETPLRIMPLTSTTNGFTRTVNQTTSRNVAMWLDGVVEVFDRGTISAFDKPAP
jgi:prepilin-type N-terminal cleavage/methylation domain-containing protein